METFQTISFEAIGTGWDIMIPRHHPSVPVIETIKERIEAFDRTYSRFRADSIVTAMSRHAGIYPLPDDSTYLIDIYQKLYRQTDGLVTPVVGNMSAGS